METMANMLIDVMKKLRGNPYDGKITEMNSNLRRTRLNNRFKTKTRWQILLEILPIMRHHLTSQGRTLEYTTCIMALYCVCLRVEQCKKTKYVQW